jgi:hypothetical protein
MNNKLKHYLLIVALLVLWGTCVESLLTKSACAQNSTTPLSANASVSKDDAHKAVGWSSSFTGQTVTRTLVVTASDGKMKDVTCSADPGSEWSGSYSGSTASFTGNQKITATANEPNSPYKPSFQGLVVLTGGSGTEEKTYAWDVEGSYEIKDVKVKKIYVNGQDFTNGNITVLIGTTHLFSATPDPDGVPWPSEKPVWNTISSPVGPSNNIKFPDAGTYTITATCTNSKSVTVKVVKPEIYSVGFSGNGQIGLKEQQSNFLYQNNGEYDITNPVWIANEKSDPIAYKQNAEPTISAVFKVSNNLTFAGTCTVKASVPYGTDTNILSGTTLVGFSGGSSSSSATLSSFFCLNQHVNSLQFFNIKWFVGNDSDGWTEFGISEHPYFVTYDNTIGTTTVKRIHWATEKADGAATITSAATMVAQALSQNPGYTPPPNSQSQMTHDKNAWRFLDSGTHGDCATLSKLAVTCLDVLGVPAEGPKYSYATNHACPIPQGNPNKLKHVHSDTCKTLCTRTFHYTHSCGTILAVPQKLIYTGNNYEAFFTVSSFGINAFTVYPFGGPFSNPNYYYLEVLLSVSQSAVQFWVNNPPITPHPTDPDNLPGTPQVFACPYCQNNFPTDSSRYTLPNRLDNSTVPYPAIPDGNDTCAK